MVAYSLREVEGLLRLSRSVVSGMISAGFVTPKRGSRGELRFDFVDLMLLRTASSLQQAKIPRRKILSSLSHLRETLPAECPLTGLRITAIGSEVAVHERGVAWSTQSGQALLDFEVAPVDGTVAFLEAKAQTSRSAEEWIDLGAGLEASSPLKAEAAYRNAIAADASLEDAHLNLGALLCNVGRGADAIDIYEAAMRLGHQSPAMLFNLALAQEDAGRIAEAASSLKRCIREEPTFRDAYFNLARLEEQLGDQQAALRHLNDYRRLGLKPG